MADVQGTFYTASKVRTGTSPSSPGLITGTDPNNPVNPAGVYVSHPPVTIGSPANGLSIDGSQVLTIATASASTVGALTAADWSTFNNKPTTFLGLTDTPSSYSGQSLKAVRVNSGETALEFYTPSGGGNIGGTIASGQIAFGTALDTIGGSNNLWWDSVNSRVGIVTNSPTNTLDVNGSTRIRTISNLGTTATRFLVASSTGVLSERTAAEMRADLAVSSISGLTPNRIPKAATSTSINDSALVQGGATQIGVIGSGATTTGIAATLWAAASLPTTEATLLHLRNDNNNFDSNPTVFYDAIRVERIAKGGTTFPSMISLGVNRYENSGTAGRTGLSLKFIHGGASTPEREILRIHSVGEFFWYDGSLFNFGTTTGVKLGNSTSQKLAFWNKTPIIQPTTAITGATRVGGGGTTLTDTDTFGGYTVAQIAQALINTGLLA